MCFGSKVKTAKPAKPPAPSPVIAEDPKGVEFGGEKSGAEGAKEDENSTDKITRIDREGDSTDIPSAVDTARSPKRRKSTMSSASVRKSLAKRR